MAQIIRLSPKGTELCVVCGEDTGILVNVPIDLLNNYREGAGQLCFNCVCRLDPELNFPRPHRAESSQAHKPLTIFTHNKTTVESSRGGFSFEADQMLKVTDNKHIILEPIIIKWSLAIRSKHRCSKDP